VVDALLDVWGAKIPAAAEDDASAISAAVKWHLLIITIFEHSEAKTSR
jgi:hypothetical protein